jgi:hypothetical protein
MYSSYMNRKSDSDDDDKKKEEGEEKCDICDNMVQKSRIIQHKQICNFMKGNLTFNSN